MKNKINFSVILLLVMLITCSCAPTCGQVVVVKRYPYYYTYGNGYYCSYPNVQTRYTCTTRTYVLRNVECRPPQNVTNVYVNGCKVQDNNNDYRNQDYRVINSNYNSESKSYDDYESFQNDYNLNDNSNYESLSNLSDWKVTIHFYRNSSRIERETANEINIKNVKDFLEKNPNAVIIMDGYSDIKTGTSEYNLRLASRRVHEVASRILQSPNISKKQIKVNIIGDRKQTYTTNKWNRCVIIRPYINNN